MNDNNKSVVPASADKEKTRRLHQENPEEKRQNTREHDEPLEDETPVKEPPADAPEKQEFPQEKKPVKKTDG